MGKIEMDAESLRRVGGWLCLDFVNTVDWHASEDPQDWLMNYHDLVAWHRWVGILTEQQADLLLEEAACRPDEATIVFEKAIFLREGIYRIFLTVVAGKDPPKNDLDLVNATLSQALSRMQIVPTTDGFALQTTGCEHILESVIWSVVQSVADLMSSKELNKVRMCENRGCGWLFVDRSRSFKRRWCDMAICGNQNKSRRHYRRRKSSE